VGVSHRPVDQHYRFRAHGATTDTNLLRS
jgi:hypothetical protein